MLDKRLPDGIFIKYRELQIGLVGTLTICLTTLVLLVYILTQHWRGM